MAEFGYMLLGERLRNSKEKEVVKGVVEKWCNSKISDNKVTTVNKVKIKDDEMYGYVNNHWSEEDLNKIKDKLIIKTGGIQSLSLSKTIKRLYVLIHHCIKNKEPVNH